MRNGYSMLMREHVEATDLGHGDCADFQVVCPCCREAVFKVGHQSAPEEGLAGRRYLAHYRASKSDIPDCERRVAGMSSAAMEQTNSVGRGQSLDAFRAVFRDRAILFVAGEPQQVPEVVKRLSQMHGRPAYMRRLQHLRAGLRSSEAGYETRMWELINNGTFPEEASPFWIKRQRAYTQSFLGHLLSSSGERSFNVAVSLGLHCAMLDVYEHPGEYSDKNRDLISTFMNDGNATFEATLDRLSRQYGNSHIQALIDATLLKALSETLMFFPYIDVLREAAAKQAPAPVAQVAQKALRQGM